MMRERSGAPTDNRRSRILVLLVGVALFASSCGGGDDANIAELQERVAELETEATASTAPTSTLAPAPSTTRLTTTTTVATSSTNWEAVDYDAHYYALYDALVEWFDSGSIPDELVSTFGASCADAADGLVDLGAAVAWVGEDVGRVVIAVENGDRPISDASDAFRDHAHAASIVWVIAEGLSERSDLGNVTILARQIGSYMEELSVSAIALAEVVFDADRNVIDYADADAWVAKYTASILSLADVSGVNGAKPYC